MLETAIQENTAAIRALIALLAKDVPSPLGALALTPIAQQERKAPPAVEEKPAPAQEPDTKAAVTYQDLARVFVDKAKAVGTPKVQAAIAPLKMLRDVAAGEQHPGQYAELLAKLNAVQ